MKKNRRKLIVGILVATMALTGVLVGTVSADEEGPANHREALTARVAELLGIEQQDLEDAFEQAMQERMGEARDDRCQALIDEGALTQEQADEMQEWFESRPDMGDVCGELGSPRMGMGGRMFQRGGPAGQMPGCGLPGSCEGCPEAS